jgi:hypothetical protein
MAFHVWKVKLENQLTQATENESEGSGSTRVMVQAQLLLHLQNVSKIGLWIGVLKSKTQKCMY